MIGKRVSRHMNESGMLKEQGKTKEEASEFMHHFSPQI